MEPPAVTVHEKIANEIGGPIRCPFCGSESWTLYDDVAVVTTRKPGLFRQRGDSIGAVGGFCDRCGFIRLHAISGKTFAKLS
jgi:hypothetical protein